MNRNDGVPKFDKNAIEHVDSSSRDRQSEDGYESNYARDMLEIEKQGKHLQLRKAHQLIWIQRFALGLGVLVMAGMAFAAYIFSHKIFTICYSPPSQVDCNESIMIATIIVPLVSITTIAIVILIAAFRQFKGGDVDDLVQKTSDRLPLLTD